MFGYDCYCDLTDMHVQ